MIFNNRCALITGAAAGIGLATARTLAAHGVRLVLTDVNSDGLIKPSPSCGRAVRTRSALSWTSARTRMSDRLGAGLEENDIKIDILINNAGIWRDNTGNFWETDPKSWIRRWRINVYGLMYLTRAILPGMIERRYGRIVNVASVAGIYGISGMTDYSATKGAVIAFTKSLAKETTGYGVTVNSVSPGNIGDGTADNGLSYAGRHRQLCRVRRAYLLSRERQRELVLGSGLPRRPGARKKDVTGCFRRRELYQIHSVVLQFALE